MNALRLQLRGSPGVSTGVGSAVNIRTMQLGFAAELTSCYNAGAASGTTTSTTSTTTTSSTTTSTSGPPGPGTTTTTTGAPAATGYCWKRLRLDPPDFVDPGVQLTGCQAFTLDGDETLGPGIVAWLDPSPDAVGYIIVAWVGTAAQCTSTTPPPCTGVCNWRYQGTEWRLVDSTCSEGCGCYYPDYCAPPCSDQPNTTTTSCFRGISKPQGPPPNCSGTTSTTTAAPGCTSFCTWRSYPALGWVKKYDPCLPSCPCATPSGAPPNDCETQTTTACSSGLPPPPPPCSGTCYWAWGDDLRWIRTSSNCSVGCDCSAPLAIPQVCGSVGASPCVGPPSVLTSTTSPPGSCTGRCTWCWTGTAWQFKSTTCVGCSCAYPYSDGSAAGETTITSCFSITTTTTSTTTSTTSTTTTSPPWYCYEPQTSNCYSDSSCSTPIGCLPPCTRSSSLRQCWPSEGAPPVEVCYNCFGGYQKYILMGGPYVGSLECSVDCPTATTSTTAPPGPDYYCYCCAGVTVCTDAGNPGGCTELSGPYPGDINCGGMCSGAC